MNHTVDVLIIGGGPAGLTAALYLGRARKSVVVVDGQAPRHAVSDGVHNFLTREGMAPAALRQHAWKDLEQFPTVRHVAARIQSLELIDGVWCAVDSASRPWRARAVLLAVGMIDEHPQIDGYQARWGTSIHHCPYCHGWEMRDEPLALLATGEAALRMAPLLEGWSDDVVVLTNGASLAEPIRDELGRRGIDVYAQPIRRLEGPEPALEAILFDDGTRLKRRGLFISPRQRPVPLVDQLGLSLDDGGYVTVDDEQRSTLPLLWAAGDCTSPRQQVVFAAAQGASAAMSINTVLTLGA